MIGRRWAARVFHVGILLAIAAELACFASASCGSAGGACCADHKCSSGSCLFTSSNQVGICSETGGIYAAAFTKGGSVSRCDTGNVYSAEQCECAKGFVRACVPWETLNAETGAVLPSSLCMCESTSKPFSAYGGLFVQNTQGGCVARNSLTGGCSCAPGTTATMLLTTNTFVSICQSKGDIAAAGFAGAFQVNEQNTCVGSNVLTGACSCGTPSNGGATICPFAGNSAVPDPNNANQPEIASTKFCALSSPPVSSAAVSIKMSAVSRLMKEGIQGEIAVNQVISLPDERGHDYSVSGIRFTSLKFTSVTASIDSRNQIAISLSGGSMLGTIGRIEVKKSFIHAHCDAHPFDLSDISVAFTVNNADLQFPGGRLSTNPSMSASSVKASVGVVNVDIHGGAICHIFKGKIEDNIRSGVHAAFAGDVPNIVMGLVPALSSAVAKNLSSYDTNVRLNTTSIFADMSVQGCSSSIEPPSSQNSSLDLFLRGSAFTTSPASVAFQSPPGKPATVDLAAASKAGLGNKDAIVCLTETPLNHLSWAAYASQTLKRFILPKDVPAASPLKLNTSNLFLAQIAPGMEKKWPNSGVHIWVACSTKGAASTPAVFQFGMGNSLGVSVELDLVWYVRTTDPQNDTQHCFQDKQDKVYSCEAFSTQLGLSFNTSFSLVQAGGKGDISLTAKLLSLNASWKVVDTQVGPISTSVLQSLDGLVIPTVMKDANEYLANQTFAVDPAIGSLSLIDVVQPTLMKTSVGSPQLCFGGNIVYKPSV